MKNEMAALLLTPQYRSYVWGCHRLRPGAERTAEVWVVHETNLVANGPLAGHSLAEVSAQMGADLRRPVCAYQSTPACAFPS